MKRNQFHTAFNRLPHFTSSKNILSISLIGGRAAIAALALPITEIMAPVLLMFGGTQTWGPRGSFVGHNHFTLSLAFAFFLRRTSRTPVMGCQSKMEQVDRRA